MDGETMRNEYYRVIWFDVGGRRSESPLFGQLRQAMRHVRQLIIERAHSDLARIELYRCQSPQETGTRIWHYDDDCWRPVLAG
jgi:hypothetical protein